MLNFYLASVLPYMSLPSGYALVLCLTYLWQRFPEAAYVMDWLLGALLVSVGATLLSLHSQIPDYLSIAIGNPLVVLGIGYYYVAARKTFALGQDYPWHWLAAMIDAIGCNYFIYVVDARVIRVLIYSSMHVMLMIATGIVFLRKNDNKTPFIEKFCAYIFIFGGFLHWSRTILSDISFVSINSTVVQQLAAVLPAMLRSILNPTIAVTLFIITATRRKQGAQL